MKYDKVIRAQFIDRPNRFIAHALLDGRTVTCHVKNTGRCRELLVPGAEVWLSDERNNPCRKTPFDLIAVKKGERLINMDSQAPNKAAAELLSRLYPDAVITAERTVGDSRIDFCVESKAEYGNSEKRYVEVKGVTLEKDGVAMFPDAPTERGVKHLDTLADCVKTGLSASVLFIIQMEGVLKFMPNRETHPAFADKLREVSERGVDIWAYDCTVTPDTMTARAPVPTKLC